jgi:ketosteroid isomerase-like protein
MRITFRINTTLNPSRRMKLIRRILLTIALALCVPCRLVAQNPPEDPAHEQLRQLRDGLLAAMNKGDLDATLAFLHTNCVITWHNAEVSRGHQGVRDYYNRVMTGPNRIVDSFHCDVKVDELTSLYAENTGICFGSSDEQFKLASGKNLNVKGRWTATLVKENGRWLVASLHVSTNLFDNVMLDLAKRSLAVAGVICFGVGVLIGWVISRRRKRATPVA